MKKFILVTLLNDRVPHFSQLMGPLSSSFKGVVTVAPMNRCLVCNDFDLYDEVTDNEVTGSDEDFDCRVFKPLAFSKFSHDLITDWLEIRCFEGERLELGSPLLRVVCLDGFEWKFDFSHSMHLVDTYTKFLNEIGAVWSFCEVVESPFERE